jgi:hypothetical protein
MLPPNITYLGSWIDPERGRCFQLMDAPDEASFQVWTSHWDDLIDFEIARVVSSEEFWSDGCATPTH